MDKESIIAALQNAAGDMETCYAMYFQENTEIEWTVFQIDLLAKIQSTISLLSQNVLDLEQSQHED